jgi:CBS domain containing-hemolysin-like protein
MSALTVDVLVRRDAIYDFMTSSQSYIFLSVFVFICGPYSYKTICIKNKQEIVRITNRLLSFDSVSCLGDVTIDGVCIGY